ncbi:MAG TPA: LysR family transcriptional regulator [Polyangiaceae bacterium]|jgi:DNA-binding transcriptional LysR family regulator
MDWDDVRVFRTIARARSLAQGAKQLGLDKSTASRRIAGLEEALGARLFLRTRDGLRPSSAGERLLVHAERMAAEARALEASAADEGSKVAGRVRIATTETLAAMLVREGLLEIRARHPGLELELLGGNRVVDLARGEADFALRVTPVTEPSLIARRIVRLSFAVYAGASYVERRGRPRSESELAGHDVLLYGGEISALPESQWLAGQTGVRVALRTSSITALLAATTDGHGVAVLGGAWVERELGLVRLFDVEALAPRPLWLVVHPDAAARTAVKLVAEHVASIVSPRPDRAAPPRRPRTGT